MIKSGATTGKVAIVDTDRKFTIWSPLAVFRSNEKKVKSKYMFYYLQSSGFQKQVELSWSFGTQQNIGMRALERLSISVPPLAEQKKIADFLDEKCGEIDSIKADVQRQIELLNDYKKSVITEAVTKGLNPKAKLKDCGIKWIGKISTQWGLSKIGNVYSLRTQKVSDKVYPPLSVTMKGVLPQLENVAKTDDGDNRKLVKKGDFVINSRSDRRGSCGISDLDGSVSLINLVLKPHAEMNPRYYNWLFHTESFADEFYSWGHGIVDDLWSTRWQEMRNITIPVPPLSEQKEIADYLDEKCSEIDAVIADKQKQLETLDEYKKSLIFEYVTGKKEVLA